MTRSERLWKESRTCETVAGRCNILDWSQIQSMPVEYFGSECCCVNGVDVEVDIYVMYNSEVLYGVIGSAAEWDAVRAHVARS